MPLQNILPDFLVAVLAAWLGATVLSRTRREYPQLVFGLLTLLAATWGMSRVIYRLSGDGTVRAVADSVTAGVATLLPRGAASHGAGIHRRASYQPVAVGPASLRLRLRPGHRLPLCDRPHPRHRHQPAKSRPARRPWYRGGMELDHRQGGHNGDGDLVGVARVASRGTRRSECAANSQRHSPQSRAVLLAG